jgi:hypothetical protein
VEKAKNYEEARAVNGKKVEIQLFIRKIEI